MKRIGKFTLETENNPSIISYASIAGKKEAKGPLGSLFDQTISDSYLGEKTWEKAESMLQNQAINIALCKANLNKDDINMVFAGDLLNQCISSTFGLRDLDIPFLGQYGACSTMAQTLLIAAIVVDCGAASKAVAVTSSHFCTAERQFRLPLEYGGQRTPTAQWTATASGSAIVGKGGKVKIKSMCVGKIIDLGVKDAANMGAAMAPAAASTIYEFFKDTNTKPENFDCIFTGDLGEIGSKLLYEILFKNGINLKPNHKDCGLMLFAEKEQDVHAGASGCGCSASVLCSYILKELEKGNLKKVLFCATGALMSPTSSQQGESIPSICHLVELVST
ncbi:MAG: stage V sporulation protein AD [Clostridia bacterium]